MLTFARARLAPLLFLLLIPTFGCKKAGVGPGAAGPAAQLPVGTLLGSVTLAPLDRIVGHVDALSRTLGLPFAGKDLLTTLAAQNGLPPEIVGEVDGAHGVALAWASTGVGKPAFQAVSFNARSADAGERLLGALGQVSLENGVRKVQRAGSPAFYVTAVGPSLTASTTLEGLAAAGALATAAAARPAEHDLLVVGHPEALARWRNTDVKTALVAYRRELVAEQIAAAERRGGPVPGPGERIMWEAVLAGFVDPLADSVTDAVSLDLDPARGIRLGFRVEPRPGTDLARLVSTPTPCSLDPALLAVGTQDPLMSLWAVGASPFWPGLVSGVLAAQAAAGSKGAAELSRRFEVLRPMLSGALSGTARAGRAGLSAAWSLPLASGVAPAAALDALAGLTTSPDFVALLGVIYGHQAPTVESRRERDTLRTELAFPVRDRPGDLGTALKAVFGSPTLSFLASASKGRLLITTGAQAGPQLVALGGNAPPRAPPPEIAALLAENKGQDGIVFLDVWAAVRPVWGALAGSPGEMAILSMLPGVGQLKLPLVISHRGGQVLTGELRIPMETLNAAAGVVRPFLGGLAR